jgi:glycosyltransferase involved in cell wall biosynthesis
MNLVFFTHPDFLGHKSMPRFARMLSEGMANRGHNIEIWSPEGAASKLSSKPFIKKWLGYFDQYVAFPRQVRQLLKTKSPDTLFVLTDQALGPWAPLVADRPHVIHCHDFMALRSALGEIPENPTGWTGKQYQQLIRRGFSKGKNFISVSQKTKEDLHRFLLSAPERSEVVYNGLHESFSKTETDDARAKFGQNVDLNLSAGYILHVGGNIWYKNRKGIVEIYNQWRTTTKNPLPLLFIGEAPSPELLDAANTSKYCWDIHWLSDIEDKDIHHAYSGASVFLFPSIGEGFGWPIAEAMASGAPVITTDEAPMTEVAGGAAYLIPRRPNNMNEVNAWAQTGADAINQILNLSDLQRQALIEKGIDNAKRFDTKKALDQIEAHYNSLVHLFHVKSKVA